MKANVAMDTATPLTRCELESIKTAVLEELQTLRKLAADRLLSYLQRADGMPTQKTSATSTRNLPSASSQAVTPRYSVSDRARAQPCQDTYSFSFSASASSSSPPTADRQPQASTTAASATASTPFPRPCRPHQAAEPCDDVPLLTCEGLEQLMAQRLAHDPQLLRRWERELERRLTAQTPTPGSTPLLITPLASCPASPLLGPPQPPQGRSRFGSSGAAAATADHGASPRNHYYTAAAAAETGGGSGANGGGGGAAVSASVRSPKPSSDGSGVQAATCGPHIAAAAAATSCPTRASATAAAAGPALSSSAAARVSAQKEASGLLPLPYVPAAPLVAAGGSSAAAAPAPAAPPRAAGEAARPVAPAPGDSSAAAAAAAAETPPYMMHMSMTSALPTSTDDGGVGIGIRRELPQQVVQEIVRQLALAQAGDRAGGGAGGGGPAAAVPGGRRAGMTAPTAPTAAAARSAAAATAKAAAARLNAAVGAGDRPSDLQQQPQPRQRQERSWQPPQWFPNAYPSVTCSGSIYSGNTRAVSRSSISRSRSGDAAAAAPPPPAVAVGSVMVAAPAAAAAASPTTILDRQHHHNPAGPMHRTGTASVSTTACGSGGCSSITSPDSSNSPRVSSAADSRCRCPPIPSDLTSIPMTAAELLLRR